MSSVGVFPGFVDHRRTIRAPTNPLDKSTVVSIFNKEIKEVKPTIQPGIFHLRPGSYEKPSLLVVGTSSWWRDTDENQPLLEIPNSSIQVADSIVKDYCNGILACDMSNNMPGLFFIPGEISLIDIKTKHKVALDTAKRKQDNWFRALVELADGLWARTNGNPLTISDDMRTAARELGLISKEWMKNFQAYELIRCAACGSMKNGQFPICPTCRAIDQSHPEAKNLKFAQ
jgi:hypothetical protein